MEKIDFYNKESRPWNGPRVYYGAIVGHTTTTTAKIWIRNRHEGKYYFFLSNSELTDVDLNINNIPASDYINGLGTKIVFHESQIFVNKTDRTHVFNASGLIPSSRYFYYLFSGDINVENRFCIGHEMPHSFQTISTNIGSLTFGFYSCHDPYKRNSGTDLWKHFSEILEEKNADFVVGGGDQVYVDSTKTDIWKWLKKNKKKILKQTPSEMKNTMLSWYQDVYRGYWGFPNVKKVHRSIPNYMIWDDHEIMDGWGSRTRAELSNELDTWYEWENKKKNLMLADSMFEASKIVYNQYQHSHNPNTLTGTFDYPLSQKHAEFYFMDMRGQREFDLKVLQKRDGTGAKDRILGKKQLNRFLDWVKALVSTPKIIYIVSPVPVIHWTGFAVNTGDVLGAKDDFRDEWDHETNHLERDKILNALFEHSDKYNVPIIFLSGDVHMSAVFRITNGKYRKAHVFQVTSSPISRPPAPSISTVILSNKGNMKTGKKKNSFQYERLSQFYTRNFCLLRSNISNSKLSLIVDFYGESVEEDEICRKRIKLI